MAATAAAAASADATRARVAISARGSKRTPGTLTPSPASRGSMPQRHVVELDLEAVLRRQPQARGREAADQASASSRSGATPVAMPAPASRPRARGERPSRAPRTVHEIPSPRLRSTAVQRRPAVILRDPARPGVPAHPGGRPGTFRATSVHPGGDQDRRRPSAALCPCASLGGGPESNLVLVERCADSCKPGVGGMSARKTPGNRGCVGMIHVDGDGEASQAAHRHRARSRSRSPPSTSPSSVSPFRPHVMIEYNITPPLQSPLPFGPPAVARRLHIVVRSAEPPAADGRRPWTSSLPPAAELDVDLPPQHGLPWGEAEATNSPPSARDYRRGGRIPVAEP